MKYAHAAALAVLLFASVATARGPFDLVSINGARTLTWFSHPQTPVPSVRSPSLAMPHFSTGAPCHALPCGFRKSVSTALAY